MEVSSNSMKVASVTVTAINQGLIGFVVEDITFLLSTAVNER
jgi:hypothetical protein